MTGFVFQGQNMLNMKTKRIFKKPYYCKTFIGLQNDRHENNYKVQF